MKGSRLRLSQMGRRLGQPEQPRRSAPTTGRHRHWLTEGLGLEGVGSDQGEEGIIKVGWLPRGIHGGGSEAC